MRIYLETLGCRLNYAEMASLGRQLSAAGYELAAEASQADLCVLNSCAVTCEATRQSRQLARQLARANPNAPLIVTGCYATLEEERVAALPNVTLVVSNQRKDSLFSLIQGLKSSNSRPSAAETASTSTCRPHPTRTRAFVKVQEGCRNHCTFCIVTVARGKERSRPIPDVVAEVNALHAEGYQEVVLTGVHLAGYGRDLGTSLYELVHTLLTQTRVPRLRLSSLEPFDLTPDFFDLWPQSDGRLMPHLHLPAQSGSDTVLRRMGRRHTSADFERLADAARRAIPGLTITTDLMAGFPGETEADFEQTLAFARHIGFAHIHAFPYSPRQGTPAARFPNQVPPVERKRRARRLHELDAELGTMVRRSYLGQTRLVLWENRGAEAEGAQTLWSGLTDNYLRVLLWAPVAQDLHNRIIPVRLARLEGNNLWGELPDL